MTYATVSKPRRPTAMMQLVRGSTIRMDNLIALPLERELMRSFLESEPGPSDEIEIHSRWLTGVGFYTEVKVNARQSSMYRGQ
jgi:hypothetical protein